MERVGAGTGKSVVAVGTPRLGEAVDNTLLGVVV